MASRLLDRIEKLSVPGNLFIGPGDLRRTMHFDTFLYYMLPQFVATTSSR